MTGTSRRPIVGGNWKMNTTLVQARELSQELVNGLEIIDPAEVVLFPPFTNLRAVHEMLLGTEISLGAQDVFWKEGGAFTGEISAPMIQDCGCEWVIVGHSERRHILLESNQIVNLKLLAALEAGLSVVLAVGETQEERESAQTKAVLQRQLTESVAGVEATYLERMVLAYEPVWAIGTGLTATGDQAQDAHFFIRSCIATQFGSLAAAAVRIQYGGSVTAANAADLMRQADVDGALVGGASLKPQEFIAIVQAVACT